MRLVALIFSLTAKRRRYQPVMNELLEYIELVKHARLGDKRSRDRLAELAAERLRVFVYRLTLDKDLAQEIVQETILEMFKVLGKLKDADKFWPWLYGIATNKIHRHQRTELTQKKLAHSTAERAAPLEQREHGLQTIVTEELKQIVAQAMRNLATRHRAVLVMRCYDGMSYAEIAQAMGRSEFSTRMLFVRAKRTLQRELSRNGFGKGSLLAALVIFGKLTAPGEAAAAQVSVTTATTSVGILAGLVGVATTKTALISLTAAAVVAGGSVVVTSGLGNRPAKISEKPADGLQAPSSALLAQGEGEQYWYYFPEGAAGPTMTRVKANGGGHAQLLQDDRANYYFDGRNMHINNHRMYAADLSVLRMPTDSPDLTAFLAQVEGDKQEQKMQYVPNREKGLLVIAARSQQPGGSYSWVTRHYNVLDEDYFQADWPTGVGTIDNRDTMHKRGWTYFKVTGTVCSQRVSGTGRIPFVYATSRRYAPWLRLKVVGGPEIIDTGVQAYITPPGPKPSTRYNSGSFFHGLARPWMGLHTIDTVRRDAAKQGIRFETRRISDNKVEVEIDCEQVRLIYTIDLEGDVVDRIIFSLKGIDVGELKFSYLQDIDDVGNEFAAPTAPTSRAPLQQDPGMLWLVRLAEGSLAK